MNQVREISTSFQTIIEMMQDRMLYESIEEIKKYRDEDLPALLRNQLRPVFSMDFATCSLRIIYDLHPKFKVNDIKRLLEFKGTILLVSAEKPSTLAMKGLHEAADQSGNSIEVFQIDRLLFNVAAHSLVSKHEPIRDEKEIEQIMKMHNARSKLQLPLIYNTDPMACYLALKPGELVRITRHSPSAGEYYSYRYCIKA